MLKITITPNYLYLEEIPEDLYEDLSVDYEIENLGKGYRLIGSPEKLYKTLLQLSYDYHISLL